MKIAVYFDQKAAIRNGHNVSGREGFINVDPATMAAEDRNLLAEAIDSRTGGQHGGQQASYSSPLLYIHGDVDAPTVEALMRTVRAKKAQAEAEAKATAEREAQQAAERKAATLAVLANRKTKGVQQFVYATRAEDGSVAFSYRESRGELNGSASMTYHVADWPYYCNTDVQESAEAMAWETELAQQRKAAEDDARAAAVRHLECRETIAKAKESREAKANAEAAEWVEKHGSKRLKRCWAEGFDCMSAYRDERLAVERPGWVWWTSIEKFCDTDDPRNPPESAFDLLDEARAIDPDCQLRYMTIEEGQDEDGDIVRDASRRYVAVGDFLGREIVYGADDLISE